MPRRLSPVALCLGLIIFLSPAFAGQYLTILHFNDFHGHLQPDAPDRAGHSKGGLARMATLIDQTRQYNQSHGIPTLLLQAGDMLQGTPLSMVYQGEPDFTCLNMLHTDAMTIGNHEFDFGLNNLLLRLAQAKFPLRSANVYHQGKLLTGSGLTIRKLGTETAAIIGLTTPDAKIESAAKNVAEIDFADPVQTMRQQLALLPPDVKVIIALTHLGLAGDLELARQVPQIDVIIGGHSHTELHRPRQVGQTLICQAGSYSHYLGQLDALVENGEVVKHRGFLRPVDQRVPERHDLATVIKRYSDKLEKQMSQVVGNTPVPLDGERTRVRSQETNLGNLIADAMRERGQAEVALVNGGGIRSSIDAGPITLGELLTVLPFSNELVTVRLTGAQLQQVLDHNAAGSASEDNGAFLQVSGLSFTLQGGAASDIRIDGHPLQADRTYKVATVDFLATGGNGYTTFAEGQDLRMVGAVLSELVLQYLAAQPEITTQTGNRIRSGK